MPSHPTVPAGDEADGPDPVQASALLGANKLGRSPPCLGATRRHKARGGPGKKRSGAGADADQAADQPIPGGQDTVSRARCSLSASTSGPGVGTGPGPVRPAPPSGLIE